MPVASHPTWIMARLMGIKGYRFGTAPAEVKRAIYIYNIVHVIHNCYYTYSGVSGGSTKVFNIGFRV